MLQGQGRGQFWGLLVAPSSTHCSRRKQAEELWTALRATEMRMPFWGIWHWNLFNNKEGRTSIFSQATGACRSLEELYWLQMEGVRQEVCEWEGEHTHERIRNKLVKYANRINGQLASAPLIARVHHFVTF